MRTEQLSLIEEMAYRLYTPSLIAIALEIDTEEFLEQVTRQGTEAHTAFYTGYLRQLDETRADTIKAARNGSNPAQIELLHFFRAVENELRHG